MQPPKTAKTRPAKTSVQPLPEGMDQLQRLMSVDAFSASISLCRDLIRDHGETALLYNVLGVAQAQMGRTTLAIKALKRAVEIAPNYDEALGNLISMLIKNEQLLDTQPYLLKALELDPENSGLRGVLAEVLLVQDDYSGALAQTDLILAQNPQDPTGLQIKKLATQELGRLN